MHLRDLQLITKAREADDAKQKARIRELEGKLDICKRYALGEIHDPCGLAADYGGTGWEKDPACVAVGKLVTQLPHKIPTPPAQAEMLDVVYAEGWNQCCDTFFGGLPPQEPVVITITERDAKPIDMVLFCPNCGTQHIDAKKDADCDGEVAHNSGWDNPPHRSHLCGSCGHIWRPADVETNGVEAVKTKGKADTDLVKPNQWQAVVPKHFTDEQIAKAMDGKGWHLYGVAPGTVLYTAPKGLVLPTHFDPMTGAGIPDPTTYGNHAFEAEVKKTEGG